MREVLDEEDREDVDVDERERRLVRVSCVRSCCGMPRGKMSSSIVFAVRLLNGKWSSMMELRAGYLSRSMRL